MTLDKRIDAYHTYKARKWKWFFLLCGF